MPTKTAAGDHRARHRRIALECSALVDLLQEIYPATATPPLNGTDREIGAWIAERKLVAGLVSLREEARTGTDGLPKILGG